MKISYYKSITAPFTDDGSRLLYSMRTTRLLKISHEVGEQLIHGETAGYPDALRQELIDMKILIPDEENELEEVILENHQAIADNHSLNFTIFTTSNCQLGCVYCGQTHSPQKLSPDLYDHILKYVESQVQALGKNRIYISWFGAEPLLGLEAIITLTPALKAIAERNGCDYGARITTNGMLFNPKNYRILRQNDVRDISISIDGLQDDHDQRRFTKGGKGSYEVIMKNLSRVFDRFDTNADGMFIRMRINVDRYNRDAIVPLLDLFREKGWDKQINAYDIAPIHSWGNDANFRSLSPEEFGELKLEFYIKLFESGLIPSVSIPGRMRITCNAVTPDGRYLEPSGKLFDCSEFPLVTSYTTDYSIGHIENYQGDTHRNFVNWFEEVYANRYPCGTCRLLPVCGGGCPKAWREGYELCPDYKHVFEDLVILSYLTTKKRVQNESHREEPVAFA